VAGAVLGEDLRRGPRTFESLGLAAPSEPTVAPERPTSEEVIAASKDPNLAEYLRKRDFEATPEPAPRGRSAVETGNSFVIHKHRATRLHYDVRLERDGALPSWAVPRGLPIDKRDKRLAVRTEDHPLEYGAFEGTIPKGHYGAGEVRIFDDGSVELSDDDETNYEMLAKPSPHKTAPAPSPNLDSFLSDEDDIALPVPTKKTSITKAAPRPKKAVVPKKTAASMSAPPKTVTLSPAAKAYALKQTKMKLKPQTKKALLSVPGRFVRTPCWLWPSLAFSTRRPPIRTVISWQVSPRAG
jgi:DNA ligase D-like protein (predicted 3'-phosphoesterase)